MLEKHLKNCSLSLVIKEIQFKTQWLRSKIQVTEDIGEYVDKEEHSSISGEISIWYKDFGNQSRFSLKIGNNST